MNIEVWVIKDILDVTSDFSPEASLQSMLISCIPFFHYNSSVNMYDGGHFASFICPHNIALLSFTYMRVSVPYVVICCIPFLFAFSLLLLHFCALPQIRPYKSSFQLFIQIRREVDAIYSHAISFHFFWFYLPRLQCSEPMWLSRDYETSNNIIYGKQIQRNIRKIVSIIINRLNWI